MGADSDTAGKPSRLYYVLPILLGVLGGVIAYFLVRKRDIKFAERLLMVGFVLTFVYAIASWASTQYTISIMREIEENQTHAMEDSADNQIRCAFSLNVMSVTGSEITVSNDGYRTVSDVSCVSSDGANIPMDAAALAPGQNSSASWSRGALTSVECSGTCLSMTVTSSCEPGDGCWK